MKRYISLLVVLTLCFALCACGGVQKPDAQEEVPAEILAVLENTYSDHPLFQHLCGRWEYRGDYGDEYPFTSLTIEADGSCVVDGIAGTWSFSQDTTEDRLRIDIQIDGQLISQAELYTWETRVYFQPIVVVIYPGEWVNLDSEEAAVAALLEDWGSDLYGQWENLYREHQGKLPPVTFFEDRTVQIGEEVLSWKVCDNWEYMVDQLEFQILSGDELRYEMILEREEGDLRAWIEPVGGEQIGLYKPGYYEILEITTENIHDYFEMVTSWEEQRNGFDELEMVDTHSDFILKEPYASRVSYLMADSWDYNVLDTGVIEWSHKVGSFDVILNDDYTFTLENCVAERDRTEIRDGYGAAAHGYEFTVPYTFDWYIPGEDLDVENWRAHNDYGYFGFEVARVKLTLYLVPERAE